MSHSTPHEAPTPRPGADAGPTPAGPTPAAARRDPAPAPARPRRDAETRRRDHAEIGRLAEQLLPDLVARLAAGDLGEIEVREDDWRLRLRRPPVGPGAGRGPGGRSARDERAAAEDRPVLRTDGARRAAEPAPAGAAPGAAATAGDPGSDAHGRGAGHHVIATSPAVGVFQPRAQATAGTRVRAGDRLAIVDLLGVPQDVTAPEDGVVVGLLVEAGEGVEYGQDLVVIEPARRGGGADGSGEAEGAAPAGASVGSASPAGSDGVAD